MLKIALILICLLCNLWTFAQNLSIDDHFTIDEGLSNNRISCILQDSTGFIWIGTANGLNKFDGYQFKTFVNNKNNSKSISNNHINSMCIGDSSELWIATNMGVNIYNPYKASFSHIVLPEFSNSGFVVNNVFRSSDGYYWFKTRQFLFKYNRATKKYQIYAHPFDEFNLASNELREPIIENTEKSLWIGTRDGLNFFDRKMELFHNFNTEEHPEIIDNNFYTLFRDSKNQLWAGNQRALLLIDPKSNKTESFLADICKKNNGILEIEQVSSNKLFIGLQNNIVFFNMETKNYEVFDNFLIRNYIVFHGGINDAFIDRTGLLWIGSNNGLIKIDTKEKRFKLYNSFLGNNSSFYSNSIHAIVVEDNDVLWLGSYRDGLYRYNRRIKSTDVYTSNPISFNRINSNTITYLKKDSQGTLWVGSANGINTITGGEVKDLTGQLSFVPNDYFKNKLIYTILPDKSDNIWVGCNTGLYQINKSNKKIISIDEEYLGEDYNGLITTHCILNENNTILFGTNIGLILFDEQSLNWQHYKSLKKDDFKEDIYCMLNSDSNIFIGTGSGLFRLNKTTMEMHHYSKNNILKNLSIFGILSDDYGILWLSTNKGLYRFNPLSGTNQLFTPADGLQSYEFNKNSCYKSNSGEMFFGGPLGVNSFFSDSVRTNLIPPHVVINSIEYITKEGIEEKEMDGIKKITIESDVKLFTITVSSLDFTNSSKNNYAYRITKEGSSEDDWVFIGTHRKVSFSNLSPGRYVFEVKGSNNDLIWGENPSVFEIYIKAPFYNTKFAIAIYIIVIITSIFLYVKIKLQRLKKANKELQEKEIIAKEVARQKEELSVRNKDITDSLNYAKRIQVAMMPQLNLFQKLFTDSMVFHKPKTIVSGDFYWISERDGRIMVAAVDCTGHGVPGAFMSLIGIELFRRIAGIRGIDQPGQILNILNENFARLFNDEAGVTLRDGMDVSLIVIDKINKTIEYAGAINPLYILRDFKIIEIKGDRFSIGLKSEEWEGLPSKRFENQKMNIEDGDVFYIFSDGFVDQFGGPNVQKYKKRRFRHLLLNIHKYSMEKQKELLNESFEIWKGENEQVDDILIIGIKP